MSAPVGECLSDGLFNQRCWSFLMQTQHSHKLFDASAFRPFLSQDGEQAMIGLRPAFAPSLERTSILKGTGSLLYQGQIMQRVKDVLSVLIATRMASEQIRLMENLHLKGIGFDHQRAASFLDRNRIAVRFVDDLAVGS